MPLSSELLAQVEEAIHTFTEARRFPFLQVSCYESLERVSIYWLQLKEIYAQYKPEITGN